MAHSAKSNPALERLLKRMPSDVVASFTPSQLEALSSACRSETARRHTLDLRLTFPFPGRGFYLVMLAGRERRSNKRLKEGNYIYTSVLGSLILIGALAAVTVPSIMWISTWNSKQEAQKDHPASIPWLLDKQSCEATGREWRDTRCWDNEYPG
ncbi:MAG: hypothetical protein ACKO7W_19925 [Elainella sp.]